MLVRALIAFLLLPGVVAFAAPVAWLWYSDHTKMEHPLGLVLIDIGFAGMIWCVRDFYVAGKGTLAPWSPPKNLVIVGLYHYSRNPMYLSVILILLGWGVSFVSPSLFIYTVLTVIAFHLRVVYGEEPWLSKVHGVEWDEYINSVPRWIWNI